MTPTQLVQAARERYNAEGDSFYSDAMIYTLIWQACNEMSLEAKVIQASTSTVSVAGTRLYNYPSNTMAIRRVEYDGDKLWPVSIDEDPDTGTTEVSGTPSSYALWDNQIVLYPTPSASADVIQIYTYNYPQEITAISTLEVPAEYHFAIINYILASMCAKDSNLQMSSYYRGQWIQDLNNIKRAEAKRQRGDQFSVVKDEAALSNPTGVD